MEEEWESLKDFPGYAVSSLGRVMNISRDSLVRPARNNHGIATVGMMVAGRHTTRSIAVLVAETFLPDRHEAFNSPINLNGDRMDCRMHNLLWRPRWFTVQYHQQFYREDFYKRTVVLELVDTGEVFEGWRDPSVTYGLKYLDIIMSYANKQTVFPTGQRFRRV